MNEINDFSDPSLISLRCCKATGCTAGYLIRDRHHMQS